MDYMAKHPSRRIQPAELVAGTVRVISVRMAYLPAQAALNHQPELAHQQPIDKSPASSTAGPGPVQGLARDRTCPAGRSYASGYFDLCTWPRLS